MQGLADGYFILPYTLGNYLSTQKAGGVDSNQNEFKDAEKQQIEKIDKLMRVGGKRTVDSFHRELGKVMWDDCGMARSAESLNRAIGRIQSLRNEYWRDVNITGSPGEPNNVIERAGRVADFMEFAEVLCRDALTRNESCGGHFRVEYQTADGEAKRDDANFAHAAVWEYRGADAEAARHEEPLVFEELQPAERSYK
jgi:succinate dehydrogenase / fumarate reductase flavoprotein subunit